MSDFSIVVGLGNPGAQYKETRHNLGFMAVDVFLEYVSRRYPQVGSNWKAWKSSEVVNLALGDKTCWLVKPQTYMNRSGVAVREFLDFYKRSPASLLVVCDDLDVAFGSLRLKFSGGDAGNNGIKSVTSVLGTAEYARLRVGLGRPSQEFGGSAADWVLGRFPKEEQSRLDSLLQNVGLAIEAWLFDGFVAAQNRINSGEFDLDSLNAKAK